jgi:hypothetical protein
MIEYDVGMCQDLRQSTALDWIDHKMRMVKNGWIAMDSDAIVSGRWRSSHGIREKGKNAALIRMRHEEVPTCIVDDSFRRPRRHR